jgi:putative membrane protein
LHAPIVEAAEASAAEAADESKGTSFTAGERVWAEAWTAAKAMTASAMERMVPPRLVDACYAKAGTPRTFASSYGHNNPAEVNMKARLLFLSLLAASATAFAQAPNDAQIAHIVVTANTVDIEAGKLAEKQAKSPEVKAFGKQMVTDHSAVNKQATDLAKKLKVAPEDNPTSQSLKSGGDANVKKLKGLKGADFDKAYVDQEVTYHQAVLDAIDKTLIPNAKNPELKALIEKVRPAIDGHLQHAKMMQAKLGK